MCTVAVHHHSESSSIGYLGEDDAPQCQLQQTQTGFLKLQEPFGAADKPRIATCSDSVYMDQSSKESIYN